MAIYGVHSTQVRTYNGPSIYSDKYFCRYMKGTQERGAILGSVEEIVLTLDDNAMNLQSMSASRFVGPFLEKVQKWEKSLSHISEVVDVSMLYVYVRRDHFCQNIHIKHLNVSSLFIIGH